MLSFLALYRGDSLQTAELVAVTTDRQLVTHLADELLHSRSDASPTDDAALAALRDGKQRALEAVRDELKEASSARQARDG